MIKILFFFDTLLDDHDQDCVGSRSRQGPTHNSGHETHLVSTRIATPTTTVDADYHICRIIVLRIMLCSQPTLLFLTYCCSLERIRHQFENGQGSCREWRRLALAICTSGT